MWSHWRALSDFSDSTAQQHREDHAQQLEHTHTHTHQQVYHLYKMPDHRTEYISHSLSLQFWTAAVLGQQLGAMLLGEWIQNSHSKTHQRNKTRWSSTANCRSVCLRRKSAFRVNVIFTLDLLTSKSNHFISVPNCTKVVNLVKFPQAVCKISCYETFSIRSRTDGRTHGQPENRMPTASNSQRRHKNKFTESKD